MPDNNALNAGDYERLWQNTWGDLQDYGPQHLHKKRLILKLLQPLQFKSALDIGCGSGTNLLAISQNFNNIDMMGVDVSTSAIEAARRKFDTLHLKARFGLLDLINQSLPEQFDLVLCCDVLEHIEDDRKAISNLAKMTGKYLLVSSPRGRMRPSERHIGHVRNYRFQEMIDKLREAGMEVVDSVTWGFPFYSPIYRDIQELFPPSIGEGKWDWKKMVISKFLYYLYWCNLNRLGDVMIVLAEKR
jgi:SAM-dependent methyltransferase